MQVQAHGPTPFLGHLYRTVVYHCLSRPVGCVWMLSAPPMEMSQGHIDYNREHHRKMLDLHSKVNYRANRETVAHRTFFTYSELLRLA